METKNTHSCPIVMSIIYNQGSRAGIPLIRRGDRYVTDNNIPMMVYNLRKMALKNIDAIQQIIIYDNRLPMGHRTIFEVFRDTENNLITLKNELKSYLLPNNFQPLSIGEEAKVFRKNYQVRGGKQ